jgi:hypothetical protein
MHSIWGTSQGVRPCIWHTRPCSARLYFKRVFGGAEQRGWWGVLNTRH